jgi:serine/threonine-protein kinase PknK
VTGRSWFGILGPLAAGLDGAQRLELGGRKQRELLALLLINRNRCLPADRIADALWRGEPPAGADATLRSHISHLRHRLAGMGGQDALVTRPAGYGLFVHPDQVDASQFEYLLELGREAVRLGETERAARLLGEALSLWRGSVLDDLGPPEFANAEAARLEELRLVALDHRIDADLALGRHHTVTAELERLVVAHPFRERLHCQLMLAHYRSGRQADALTVASSVRQRLAEELGVDPGPALRELETAILRHDPALQLVPTERDDFAMRVVPSGALTKYRPPTPAHSLVSRARLIDKVRAGGRRRLIVVHGPAGFGKTTLAAQWREVLVEENVTVAWLTIDSDDNNVVWFLAHLIEAVRSVRPGLAEGLRETLEEYGEQAARSVMASLIDQIEGSPRIVVIIDDWHRVTDAATIEALAHLLDCGGQHLQLVVTSRTRAGLPWGRLRVRDELIEIDGAALRFDLPEARAFLVELGGLVLDARDVALLEKTTDGWVAALQLASLSLRDCDDPAALISGMSGRHHAIGEYLAENVLDSLEPQMLDFLMTTSLTERISGDLACVLAGVGHGQALLELAEDRDLFLRRLDENREWFRYHHLFAEFLQRRLMRESPERIKQLHAAASRWFAEHHMLREAVDHALAAGNEERATELIELHGIELVEHSQMGTLLALVSKLPPHTVALSPRLQVTIAFANSLLQRPAATHLALDAFESAAQNRTLPATVLADMRIEADVIRAVSDCYADRISGVDELVSECLSRPDSLAPWVVAVAADVASFLQICRFDFDAARRWQDWATPYHQRTHGPFTLVYGHCLLGIIANEELDIAEAERCFGEALQVARRSLGVHSHAAQLACALLGELLYERGDIDEADRLLDESYQLGAEGGVVEIMIARYVTGARIKAVRGDLAAAATRLDDGARAATTFGLARLGAHIENERMRLDLPRLRNSGRDAQMEPLPDAGLGEITAQLHDEAEIRGLLEDQPALACERAHAWVQRLEHQRRPRALLQANRLLVAALSAAGKTDDAKQTLAHIAAQCADREMTRYLLDGGLRVVALLRELREGLHSGHWKPTWPAIPVAFLDTIVGLPEGFNSGATTDQRFGPT